MSDLLHVPRLALRTDDFKTWAALCWNLQLELKRSSSERPFQAGIESLKLGSAFLRTFESDACSVERKLSGGKGAVPDHMFFLIWQLRGAAEIEQNRHGIKLTPGKMGIYRLNQAYKLFSSDNLRLFTLLIDLADRPEWRALAERFCGKELPVDGMAQAAIAAAMALLKAAPAAGFEAAIDPICELVFQSLWQHTRQIARDPCMHARRVQDARRVVHIHYADADFGPMQLASALGISRRTLYEAFRKCGLSPAHFILSERLALCHRTFTNRTAEQQTITEIAFAHGFSDSAHFSRVFRSRYGTSPSELRRQAQGQAPVSARDET